MRLVFEVHGGVEIDYSIVEATIVLVRKLVMLSSHQVTNAWTHQRLKTSYQVILSYFQQKQLVVTAKIMKYCQNQFDVKQLTRTSRFTDSSHSMYQTNQKKNLIGPSTSLTTLTLYLMYSTSQSTYTVNLSTQTYYTKLWVMTLKLILRHNISKNIVKQHYTWTR